MQSKWLFLQVLPVSCEEQEPGFSPKRATAWLMAMEVPTGLHNMVSHQFLWKTFIYKIQMWWTSINNKTRTVLLHLVTHHFIFSLAAELHGHGLLVGSFINCDPVCLLCLSRHPAQVKSLPSRSEATVAFMQTNSSSSRLSESILLISGLYCIHVTAWRSVLEELGNVQVHTGVSKHSTSSLTVQIWTTQVYTWTIISC